MAFDLATAVVLACMGAVWWALQPVAFSHRLSWVTFAATSCVLFAVRGLTDARTGLECAAAALLIAAALCVGRDLFLRGVWPKRAMVVAVATVTATGAYLRADRLDDVLSAGDRLQPDVRYYQEHALETADPFAAGQKSPLWSAIHAPIVRHAANRDAAMRLLSWCAGILMLPAVAFALGRLFDPLVGVLVSGSLAVDTWLIDLCCQGLREEAGVCMWMLILALLFTRTNPSWRRVLGAGIAGGVLLLLRNIDVVPLVVLTAWASASNGWGYRKAALALLLPVVIVAPFYVNQYRAFGDPFAMEKRDARYHANLEFRGRALPPEFNMPTSQEYSKDLFAGSPLSPLTYLLHFHTPAEFVRAQVRGVAGLVMGEPFQIQASEWTRLLCAVGLIATCVSRRHRFAILFVFASLLGMRAHLQAIGQLEQRLLLPIMVVWLASGTWLLAEVVRQGGLAWLKRRRNGEQPRTNLQ